MRRLTELGLLGPIFELAVYNLFSSFVQTAVLRFSQTLKVRLAFCVLYMGHVRCDGPLLTLLLRHALVVSSVSEVGGAIAGSCGGHAERPGERYVQQLLPWLP
jgi:hypothetical protein